MQKVQTQFGPDMIKFFECYKFTPSNVERNSLSLSESHLFKKKNIVAVAVAEMEMGQKLNEPLTHCGLGIPIGNMDLDQHCFR